MLKFRQNTLALVALVSFFMVAVPQARAADVEVRDWSEIQKELDAITSSPELQKVLNHPEVRKALNAYQAQVNQLKAEAKAQVETKVENTKNEAQAIAEERWQATVGKLIEDYKNSDIPRKLEQGDWSAIEETKALLRALPLPEEITPEETPYYEQGGKSLSE